MPKKLMLTTGELTRLVTVLARDAAVYQRTTAT